MNNRLATEILGALTGSLKVHQQLAVEAEMAHTDGTTILIVRVTSRLGGEAVLAVWVHERIDPRRVYQLVEEAEHFADTYTPPVTPILAARYLPVRARQILCDLQTGFADATGNVSVRSVRPYAALTGRGGTLHDPWAPERGIELRSLGGPATGRCLRALLDAPPPASLEVLAATARTSVRTAGRVLAYLADEGALDRSANGAEIANLDAESVLRLWAVDYTQVLTNRSQMLAATGTIEDIAAELRSTTVPYAATGALAAWYYPTILPVDWVTVYVHDAADAASAWRLDEADTTRNMLLLEPYDRVVFEHTVERDGIRCVAPAQLAIDLLTGPGREPSQGEHLLNVMEDEAGWLHVA